MALLSPAFRWLCGLALGLLALTFNVNVMVPSSSETESSLLIRSSLEHNTTAEIELRVAHNNDSYLVITQQPRRVLVVMAGQTARQGRSINRLCTKRGKQLQMMAADSQKHNLIEPLIALGYEVDLRIVTNECDSDWESNIRDMYAPYASQVTTINDTGTERWDYNRRGAYMKFMVQNITMSPEGRNAKVSSKYSKVIYTRPDITLLSSVHAKKLVEEEDVVMFSFKCQPSAGFDCVDDIVTSMDGDFFFRFADENKGCLGRPGCFGPTKKMSTPDSGFPNATFTYALNRRSLCHSGHACSMCIKETFPADDRPKIKYLVEGNYRVNARVVWNPVFSMNNG
mmetsp:Transcript_19188/g.38805  ORF Transcript_19188/g.38805 Transcript_19188/m.38805 type:complete len:341 (+) Transcript_19188:135-1157(+)